MVALAERLMMAEILIVAMAEVVAVAVERSTFTGSPPVATITASGGAGGGELSRNSGCVTAVPALAGSAGSTVNFYTYARSLTPPDPAIQYYR